MDINSIKVVILAGGYGTRLRSVVSEVPKPMAPIQGKPFLEYQIDYLKKLGFRNIILCISYLKEQIIDYFKDGSKFGLKIEYRIEEEPLGTGGAIKNVEDLVGELFFVVNGDTYPLFNILESVKFYHRKKPSGCLGVIMVSVHKNGEDKGTVKLGEDGKIVTFNEKKIDNSGDWFVNAGVYFFDRSIFYQDVWERKCSLEKDIFPRLINKGLIFGMKTNGSFIDMGTLEVYKSLVNRQFAFPDLLQ